MQGEGVDAFKLMLSSMSKYHWIFACLPFRIAVWLEASGTRWPVYQSTVEHDQAPWKT